MSAPEADHQRMRALERAVEVAIALEVIARYRDHLVQLLANHDPTSGDNARRRDCATFRARLEELLLWERAQAEAQRGR